MQNCGFGRDVGRRIELRRCLHHLLLCARASLCRHFAAVPRVSGRARRMPVLTSDLLLVSLLVVFANHITNHKGRLLVLWKHEFLHYGLEFGFLNQVSKLEVVLGAALQTRCRVMCVINQLPSPARCLRLILDNAPICRVSHYSAHTHVQGSCGLVARRVLIHLAVQEGQLQQVLRQEKGHRVLFTPRDFAVALEESVRGVLLHLELEASQDLHLHVKDLGAGKAVLRHMNKVLHCRWVDLLILCCNQHRSSTDQLHLVPAHLVHGEVAINDVDNNEEGFGEKLELLVNLQDPVYEHSSHIFVDLNLSLHVRGIWLGFELGPSHVGVDVPNVLRDVVNIGQRRLIHWLDIFVDVALVLAVTNSHFLVEENLWQFVCRPDHLAGRWLWSGN